MLAPNQVDQIILSIERTQRAVYIFCALTILILLSCASYGCLFLQICHISDDINIPPYTSHTFLPVCLIMIILCFFSYHSAKYIHINYLGPLRFLILVFLILITFLTISEFIAGLSLTNTDRDSVWGKLPPLAKKYYDYSESNMNDVYMNNIIYLFAVQICACVLFLGVLITVWILYSKTPMGYLPRMQNVMDKGAFEVNRGVDETNRPESNLVFDNTGNGSNPLDPQRNEGFRERNPLASRDTFEDRPRNTFEERPRNTFEERPRSTFEDRSRSPYNDRPDFNQEIREDDDEHPLAPSNPFLRGFNK